MSETPIADQGIDAALLAFTGCVGNSVADLCSYGLTIGDTYVPFDPDPEDLDEDCDASCSQLWVRVMSADMAYVEDGFDSNCGGTYSLTLEVGIIRCVTIPEEGEAPAASDVMMDALQAMQDMQDIRCAAMNCEVWDSIVSGTWSPNGPIGGQYGGTWTFTVETSGFGYVPSSSPPAVDS